MSNQSAQGRIQKINERDGQYGKMYSIQVDGQWYSAGKCPPKAVEGDYVEFEWVAKGNYRNADPKTIRKAQQGSSPVPAAASGAPSAPFVDKRQDIISAQWGINAAIQTVNILAEAEAFPGLKKTANAEEKYDYVKALITELAGDYVFMATGKSLPEHVVTVSGVKGDQPDEEWK